MPPEAEPSSIPQLEAAYVAGDFAALRRMAARVLNEPGAASDKREAARAWLARISIDASAWALLAFATLLFCAIVIRYAL